MGISHRSEYAAKWEAEPTIELVNMTFDKATATVSFLAQPRNVEFDVIVHYPENDQHIAALQVGSTAWKHLSRLLAQWQMTADIRAQDHPFERQQ